MALADLLFSRKRPRWATTLIILYVILLAVVILLSYYTIIQAKCDYSFCMGMCSDNIGALRDTYQQGTPDWECRDEVKGEFDRIFSAGRAT